MVWWCGGVRRTDQIFRSGAINLHFNSSGKKEFRSCRIGKSGGLREQFLEVGKPFRLTRFVVPIECLADPKDNGLTFEVISLTAGRPELLNF
jgi:hypothetical protein